MDTRCLAKLTAANTPSTFHPWLDELNGLYEVYVRVMVLKGLRDQLHGAALLKGYLYAGYGYARDVWFNLTTASKIFNDCARELTVTARLKRYRKHGTLAQQVLADFLCDKILDAVDPSGEHC